MKAINGAPLQRIVLKDRVAELIKDAILNGRLEPGDRIVEMKVASDLGVGTTAVREALFELVQERGAEADFAALEKLVHDMTNAAMEGNFQGFYRSDLEFHRTIWSLSGNRFVAKALDNTVVPLFAFFIMKNPRDSVADLVTSAGKHAEVVRALREGKDARRHMEGAIKFFAQQEKRLLFEGPPKQG